MWDIMFTYFWGFENFCSDTGEFHLLQRKSVSTWQSPFSLLQVTESDTMRTLLSSILWALLLHCCCQTAQAEVFTSISRFKYRFNLITLEGFWTQTSISEKKWRSNDNLTKIYCHLNVLITEFTLFVCTIKMKEIHKISLERVYKFLSLNQLFAAPYFMLYHRKKVIDT